MKLGTHGLRQFTRQSNSCVREQSKADIQPLPGEQGSAHVMVSWEDEHCHPDRPFLLLFPSLYHWLQHHMVWDVPLTGLAQLS